MFLREQVYKPLLGVHDHARQVAEEAILTYYTGSPGHLKQLERDLQKLESATAGLRLALEALRSRGDDPLEKAFWPTSGTAPSEEVPF